MLVVSVFLRKETFCHRNLSSFLDKWISLLAVWVMLKRDSLPFLQVIGCSPKTDELVCGTAKKRVSSYQNPASPLRSGRRRGLGGGEGGGARAAVKEAAPLSTAAAALLIGQLVQLLPWNKRSKWIAV